jgi:chromosomal replication initiation ATPase DnaA
MEKSALVLINNAVSHAPGMYCRLILLVGPSGSGKTSALQELSEKTGKNIINVNLEMSRALLEIPVNRRESRVSRIFNDLVRDDGASSDFPVLLDNLEILFDKDLKQDPLVLLQNASHNYTVIASWNGTCDRSKLTFAVSGHPEYRYYGSIDAQIIEFTKETELV